LAFEVPFLCAVEEDTGRAIFAVQQTINSLLTTPVGALDKVGAILAT